jgi:glutamate/tyrosine decarboxylase-like PLP-dependent enzyme
MPRPDVSPADFRRFAHQFSDIAADYLEKLPSLPSFPSGVNGESTQQMFDTNLPLDGLGERAFDMLSQVAQATRPNSPRFFGYVFGSALPLGILGDFYAAVLNQNVTAWRSSPAAITIERTVVRWLAEAVGCAGFSGSLTGGGSAANLMGLCMAREAKTSANDAGSSGGIIYCSAEAHMSIPKAAMLLGLGRSSVRRVPVDGAFRMDLAALRNAIHEDLGAGRKPIAVVASAGTVATGSIDPLPEIASLCREHNLWMHVDGAYGALAALALPENSAASTKPTRYLSIPTSGSTNPPAADACSIAIPLRPKKRLPIPRTTPAYSRMIRSRASHFSKSLSSSRVRSAR